MSFHLFKTKYLSKTYLSLPIGLSQGRRPTLISYPLAKASTMVVDGHYFLLSVVFSCDIEIDALKERSKCLVHMSQYPIHSFDRKIINAAAQTEMLDRWLARRLILFTLYTIFLHNGLRLLFETKRMTPFLLDLGL